MIPRRPYRPVIFAFGLAFLILSPISPWRTKSAPVKHPASAAIADIAAYK
jgi:hypothetical protein